jgi:Uma2 family endonuclease
MTQQLLNEETANDDDIVHELDISHLVIEDDTPVDNFQSAQQQRLLVEPLYSAEALPMPFIAEANVGLFYKLKGDPIVPDVLLSLDVQRAEDYDQRRYRSYFVWEFGKVPEVCLEIVSNQEGDELALSQKSRQKGKPIAKKETYARVGIPYYVVFDPLQQIQGQMDGALVKVFSISPDGYTELVPTLSTETMEQSVWLSSVGIGLTLWEGQFEDEVTRTWLRWCDRQGRVIPTGAELAREAGVRAGNAESRAEDAESRAEDAESRAEDAESKAQRLAERLRSLGIDPDEV